MKQLPILLSLLLVACGPIDPTPTPSASTPADVIQSSTEPSVLPSISASPIASAPPTSSPAPSSLPSALPSVSVTPVPSALPTAVASVAPIPVLEGLQGVVFNHQNKPLSAAKVQIKALNSSLSYERETTTDTKGLYVFKDAPSDVELEITVTKENYSLRKWVEVLKAGDPLNTHQIDFNQFERDNKAYDLRLFLSPEITQVYFESKGQKVDLERNNGAIPRDANILVQFNKPMQVDTAASTLLIEEVNAVDPSKSIKLNQFDFYISWNVAEDAMTLKMRNDPGWPEALSHYQLSFTNNTGILLEHSGISKNAPHFKLDQGPFTSFLPFTMMAR